MSGEYKAACGCEIHVTQWTAKRKVVSQKSCALHEAAPELLKALKALLPKGWGDGTMDHMPGVKQAREAIAKATEPIAPEDCSC
jgi:hypothetical protein